MSDRSQHDASALPREDEDPGAPAPAPASATSIRQPISTAILSTVLVSLLLFAAASTALDLHRQRTQQRAALARLAQALAPELREALQRGDAGAAQALLTPLVEHSVIEAAVLEDGSGRRVAAVGAFARAGASPPPAFAGEGWIVHTERLGPDALAPGSLRLGSRAQPLAGVLQRAALSGTLALVVALLLCGAASARLQRRIVGPLRELDRAAAAMQRGDLSGATRIARSDEIGALARAFDRTRDGLRTLVAAVREHALAIGREARTLEHQSRDLSEQAERQHESVARTRASVEGLDGSTRSVRQTVDSLSASATENASAISELDATARRIDDHMDVVLETVDGSASSLTQLGASVRQIAGNASSLAATARGAGQSVQVLRDSVQGVTEHAKGCEALATRATESARHGSHVVGEALGGMGRIHQSFRGLEQIVAGLATRSEAIDEVVEVIEAVVKETNLLALNASIISSQAGEHGRAFAVVAQEVKNLAQRTAGSTREITDAMSAVRGGIAAAVEAVGEGSGLVGDGMALSEEAARALEEIRSASERSRERVCQIVGASEQQGVDIDDVERAMQTLLEGVDQISAATNEQQSVATELLGGVEAMRELARDVKVATSEQSRQSGHMGRSVEEVAAGMHEIQAAAEAQQADVETIVAALEVFESNTEESGRRAEALARCVERLRRHSGQLEAGVRRFDV